MYDNDIEIKKTQRWKKDSLIVIEYLPVSNNKRHERMPGNSVKKVAIQVKTRVVVSRIGR